MMNEKKDVNRSRRRILIVDDYSGLRRALMRLIDCESDLEVCAVAGNVGQALSAIEEQSFDLAIVDISLGSENGLELTEAIKSRCPDMPVLVFSAHDDSLYVEYALQSGAQGYLVKLFDTTKEILTAIRRVHDRQIYINSR
jgi:DNA-binding NarL/FixJ family response regulator